MATVETINRCFQEYFQSMRFVSKAIAKDDTRPLLTFIKVEKTADDKRFAYAADGFRLHIADISECPPIPEGLYSVIKSTKKELLLQKEDDTNGYKVEHYPNIWDLIPDAPQITDFIQSGDVNVFSVHIIKRLSDGNGINLKYLSDITEDNHEWSMWYNGKSSPIGFKNHTLCAVIMPMFIEPESKYDYQQPIKKYDRHPSFIMPETEGIEVVTNIEDDITPIEDNEPIVDNSSNGIEEITPDAVNKWLQDNHVPEINIAISKFTPETIVVCAV